MSFFQVAQILPEQYRIQAEQLTPEEGNRAEEIRLRVGRPMSLVFPEGEYFLKGQTVITEDIAELIERASQSSVHAVMDQLRNGFLILPGGHRVGLCGTAVIQGGEVYALRQYSSASIRIAHEVKGVALPILGQVSKNGRLQNTLILSPPGLGKTTLLRDMIRAVSEGDGVMSQRVGVADERGEVAALYHGEAQLDVGPRTDVIEGCKKAQGLLLLLRSMSPQVLAADEITAPEDVDALLQAYGCGTVLLTTAHGINRDDLIRRPVYRRLIGEGVFEKLITISSDGGSRLYEVEDLL